MIGSGPAGLACAHDLALMGYPVTIFEAAPVAGGMLRLGVPEYRLPRALIQLEVNAILSLGVELKTGVRLGRDFTLADLRAQGFSAIFLGSRRDAQPRPRDPRDGAGRRAEGDRLPPERQPRLQGRDGRARRRHRRRQRGPRRGAHRGPQRRRAENLQRNLSVVQALDVARSAIRFGAREVDGLLPRVGERDARRAGGDRGGRGARASGSATGVGPKRLVGKDGDRDGRRVPRRFARLRRDGPLLARSSSRARRRSSRPTPSSSRSARPETSRSSARKTGSRRAAAGSRSTRTRSRRAPAGVYAGGDAAFGPRIAINAVADGKTRRALDRRVPPRPRRARRPRSPSRSTSTTATRGPSTTRGSRGRSPRPARSPAASASPRSRSASPSARRASRERAASTAGPTRSSRRARRREPSASSAAAARTSARRTASRSSSPSA